MFDSNQLNEINEKQLSEHQRNWSFLKERLTNKGVAVEVSASHTCACLRGVKHDGCEMKTARLSGDFLQDPATRNEFYQFVNQWHMNR